jgi:hypothetical protein
MRGGDILGPFLQYARAAGMKGFVTWRMNDAQAFAHYQQRPLEDQFKVSVCVCVCVMALQRLCLTYAAPRLRSACLRTLSDSHIYAREHVHTGAHVLCGLTLHRHRHPIALRKCTCDHSEHSHATTTRTLRASGTRTATTHR